MQENRNELLTKIVVCGGLIEKKRVHFKKIAMPEDVLLNGLTVNEQETLGALLTKMQDYWIAAHKARHAQEQAQTLEQTQEVTEETPAE